MPTYMTPEEVMEHFRLKRVKTVYEWIAEGRFPNVICISRQYRIPQDDVEHLAAQSRPTEIVPAHPAKRRVISRGVQ